MELSKAGRWPEQTRSYIEDVRTEMRRVSWPSWPQVRSTTGVVIAAVFLFGAYFWIIDKIVESGISLVIDYFIHHR